MPTALAASRSVLMRIRKAKKDFDRKSYHEAPHRKRRKRKRLGGAIDD